jgi:hypothetical protein
LIGFNNLNGAQRLNVWNDWNGLQYFNIMAERLEPAALDRPQREQVHRQSNRPSRFEFTKRREVLSLLPISLVWNDWNDWNLGTGGAEVVLGKLTDWNGLQYYRGTAGTSTFLRRVKLGN